MLQNSRRRLNCYFGSAMVRSAGRRQACCDTAKSDVREHGCIQSRAWACTFAASPERLAISDPARAVHVGDDAAADVAGAAAVGLSAWLWKEDVTTFEDVATRILH
eukprot:jgi/Mesen1/10899/ME000095S10234